MPANTRALIQPKDIARTRTPLKTIRREYD
jgi:hypothetical protein